MTNKTLEQLNWRYAVKSFDPAKKLSPEKLDLLLETLRLSASSFGLQPWKFLVVKNPELRQELKAHSWNQGQVVDASHLIVLCSFTDMDDAHVDKYLDSLSDARGLNRAALKGLEDMVKGFIKRMDGPARQKWMRDQVYLALGSLLTVCALEHVDACPMEGFTPAEYDRILKLKEKGLKSVVVVPVGYRSESDKYSQVKKVRFPLNQVVEYVE